MKKKYIYIYYTHPSNKLVMAEFSFSFVDCIACGILDTWPGIEPVPSAIKSAESEPLDYQGVPLFHIFSSIIGDSLGDNHLISIKYQLWFGCPGSQIIF